MFVGFLWHEALQFSLFLHTCKKELMVPEFRSTIRSLDRVEVVSISYDSKSPHGNINNKSIVEGDKFAQSVELVF
jgi:hypothetical protein